MAGRLNSRGGGRRGRGGRSGGAQGVRAPKSVFGDIRSAALRAFNDLKSHPVITGASMDREDREGLENILTASLNHVSTTDEAISQMFVFFDKCDRRLCRYLTDHAPEMSLYMGLGHLTTALKTRGLMQNITMRWENGEVRVYVREGDSSSVRGTRNHAPQIDLKLYNDIVRPMLDPVDDEPDTPAPIEPEATATVPTPEAAAGAAAGAAAVAPTPAAVAPTPAATAAAPTPTYSNAAKKSLNEISWADQMELEASTK